MHKPCTKSPQCTPCTLCHQCFHHGCKCIRVTYKNVHYTNKSSEWWKYTNLDAYGASWGWKLVNDKETLSNLNRLKYIQKPHEVEVIE